MSGPDVAALPAMTFDDLDDVVAALDKVTTAYRAT